MSLALFPSSRRDGALSPKKRCTDALSLHVRCSGGTLSPHARCVSALSPTTKCTDGVLREKREVSRPFLKVDDLEDHPCHLGELAFSFLTYGEDPLDPSSKSSTRSIPLSL